MKTFIAVTAVILWSLSFQAKAEEPKRFLTPAHTRPAVSGGAEFAKLAKLSLDDASAGKLGLLQIQPKFEPSRLSITVPIPTNALPALPDERISLPLQPPEKTPFQNLHYVHREWRVGDGIGGEDSFGRLWKLSPKSELVFPYFKWEYPTRNEERVLVGIFLSRKF